jgi:glycosyltransferase involved in cell wall biosynthesis
VLAAVKGIAVGFADISVVTATIPSRTALLSQAIASVAEQTLQPLEHLIAVDLHRNGGGPTKNRLIESARGEWIAILDDDDILKSNHLEVLFNNAGDADIVASYAEGPGYTRWYNVPFNPENLKHGNSVGHNALIRKDLFERIGMFGSEHGYDWTFWARAHAAGAKFSVVPIVTWVYRINNEWEHESKDTSGLAATQEMVRQILG